MGRGPVILVTGAGGQVGTALRRVLPDARFATREDLDVTDADAVSNALNGVDCVVHLAAFTDVDGCEREPELARSVNTEGTANVALAAAANGTSVLYVSTDYVFDGSSDDEYREDDPVRPISVYGATKETGEQHVRELPHHLIVRTSWVFGDGRNFVRTIAGLASSRDSIEVVDDQRGRPTYAVDLAAAIGYLIETEEEGTLHVTGDGPPCSWAELAEEVVTTTGGSATVRRIDSRTWAESRPNVAPRPANSTLSLEKARSIGVPLRSWRDGVHRYLRSAT